MMYKMAYYSKAYDMIFMLFGASESGLDASSCSFCANQKN